MVQVKGIYASREFYVVDYDAGKNNIPEYQSTIYWQYNVPVKTQEDMLYGEQTFNVKKKLP
jgi:hypothetical protein